MQLSLFKKIANLFILALVLIGFQNCHNNQEKVEERGAYIIPDSLLKTLKMDTVGMCPLVTNTVLTGIVDFNQDKQVNIYPLVSGNIQDVKVQLGDYVTAGQTLGVVKSGEMAGYSNNLIVAQTNVTATKKQLDAQKDLFKSGLASSLDVSAAQTNYDQALAQLQLANRVLNINGNNTKGEYVVKAPISGFIVQKNVTNSTSIRTDNGNAMFTISDLKNVWIQANVYESNISKVHVGDPVTVTTLSYPDKKFYGRIDKIMNVLDPTNKVMKVRVVLPNDNYELKPQMFASVNVETKENQQAICISFASMTFQNSRYFVLLYKGNGVAQITPVEILSSSNDKTYISSGVKPGDILIGSQVPLIYDALNN